jgi:CDP-diacylglycerol--serine O-phosphatidyltransferase
MEQASRARLFVPNTITAANIAVGFIAMLAAGDGRFELAVYLMLLALLLDTFDGRIARRLKATSKFGQEMDSLSDSLSFCAAPAFLVHRAILVPLGAVGVVVSLLYLLAGVFRLARFNLTSDVHEKARRTTGVPTPIGAGYLMALVLMRDRITPSVAALVVLTMALLMISRLSLPEMRGRSVLTYTLLAGMLNFIAVVFWPNWLTIGWWNIWNVIILLVAKGEDRRLADLEEAESPT